MMSNLIRHRREKREMFSAIGAIFKSIPGLLDNDYAEYYNNSMDKISAKKSRNGAPFKVASLSNSNYYREI